MSAAITIGRQCPPASRVVRPAVAAAPPVLYWRYAADVASETSIDAGSVTQEGVAERRKWHQPPTIRTLKRRAVEEREFAENWDCRDNDETRLPANEAVHFPPCQPLVRQLPGRNR
jgi:hypothetical protein